jgi:hypothetical protein
MQVNARGSVENPLVVSWLGTGMPYSRSDRACIAYGWVERRTPTVNLLFINCNKQVFSYPV